MRKILMPLLLGLLTTSVRRFSPYRRSSLEIARLKMSLTYLRGVETFRLLFINLLGLGVCLIFLISGLLLVPSSLIFYAPWDHQTKMYVGFGCALLYLLISVGVFSYLVSQTRWLEIFHASGIAKDLASKANGSMRTEKASEHPDRMASVN